MLSAPDGKRSGGKEAYRRTDACFYVSMDFVRELELLEPLATET